MPEQAKLQQRGLKNKTKHVFKALLTICPSMFISGQEGDNSKNNSNTSKCNFKIYLNKLDLSGEALFLSHSLSKDTIFLQK